MKTYNVKTYRSVLFELNHCVEAEDEASAMDQCIRWYEPNEIMTVDNFLEWIDPKEDEAYRSQPLADLHYRCTQKPLPHPPPSLPHSNILWEATLLHHPDKLDRHQNQ